jgi:hypothetical protein
MINNNLYERLFVVRYQAGGHARETALHFARGEIKAIQIGNHWTQGKPGSYSTTKIKAPEKSYRIAEKT